MKQNLIIRASAGTGKTFSLATRFIRLMVFDNVPPTRIVALTFSRAAAREIYIKLLERLWRASATQEGAKDEERLLKQGLSSQDLAKLEQRNIDFSSDRFTNILRQTVDAQNISTIATLDSFILRIVRSFPLEMGFQQALSVLDEFGEVSATKHVGNELLRNHLPQNEDVHKNIMDSFQIAQNGKFNRTCQIAFETIITQWHKFLVEHPEAKSWTANSMCIALGIPLNPIHPETTGLTATGNNAKYFTKFCDYLTTFNGTGALFPDTKLGEMMRFFIEHPTETIWQYETGTTRIQTKICNCGEAGANAVRAGIKWMVSKILRHNLEVVAAKLKLCSLFETVYDTTTRQQGNLTFADFTNSQAFAEGSDCQLQLENIQYRFDERFTHWALDEFQDTSKLQWQCLKRLVREAAGGEGRSVMIVGDLKQSIYGWRGGDDGPFREVMEDWGEFRGTLGESLRNDISYRYEQNTVDFINCVFGPNNLQNSTILGNACTEAITTWLSENCWMTHRADNDKQGNPKKNDYVELILVPQNTSNNNSDDVPPPTNEEDENASCSAAMKILAPKICILLKDLWQFHEHLPDGKKSTDTIGILVRDNKDGNYLAEYIRALDGEQIPVIWEGVNGILDTPVVQAILELLKLAIHPEDTFAWTSINRLFPIRQLVFPNLTTHETVASQVMQWLARLGLSRTLRLIVSRITLPEAGLSARSRENLEDLVRLAVTYETREDGDEISKFPKFLALSASRESGESPRVVRILTIHRSKGLTLDHVIVPIRESGKHTSITKPDTRQRFSGDGWVLDCPTEDIAISVTALKTAWKAKSNERFMEALRLNYVALTRARKSTYIFVVDEAHTPAVQFRDLLTNPFKNNERQSSTYGDILFSAGTPFRFGYRENTQPEITHWAHTPGLSHIMRRSPSSAGTAVAMPNKTPLSILFSTEFGEAAKRGLDVHEQYAKITWATPEQLKTIPPGLHTAFAKPTNDATVWCEHSYELFDGENWESGRFDRVVFYSENGTRHAIIYDFKTNRKKNTENESEFVNNLIKLYKSQMTSYQYALNRLTNIPKERIHLILLLTATGQVVQL